MYDGEINVVISNQPLYERLAELEAEVTALNRTITTLSEEVTIKTAQIETLTAQVSELTTQVEALTAQVNALTTENSELRSQVAELQASVQNLTQNLNLLLAKINSINGETVQEPADYLEETKSQILTAIQSKGSSATTNTTFREYANIISHFNVLPDGDEHTTLLLHLDSDNQWTDSSIYRHPITIYGTPTIDTTKSKFGNGSLYLDGSSCLIVNQTDYFPFGHEFTFEFFIYKDLSLWAYNRWYGFFDHNYTFYSVPTASTTTNEYNRFCTYDSYYTFNYKDPSSTGITSPRTTAIYAGHNKWSHIALVKKSCDADNYFARVYIDGNFVNWYGTIPTANYRQFMPLWQYPTPLYLFGLHNQNNHDGYSCFPGWFNELRISNVCRYTSNFTPPTEPFSV